MLVRLSPHISSLFALTYIIKEPLFHLPSLQIFQAFTPDAANLVAPPLLPECKAYSPGTKNLVFPPNPSMSVLPVHESKPPIRSDLSSHTLLRARSYQVVDESTSTLASPRIPHRHSMAMLFFASHYMFLSTPNRFNWANSRFFA